MKRLLAAALMYCSIWVVSLSAHRLDECLQATRIAIDPSRVTIELDVTPGASMAPQAHAWMADRERFAHALVGGLTLWIDGHAIPIELTARAFPDPREFETGNAMVRLRAIARLPALERGPHRLSYENGNERAPSVYLANALVPSSERVRITGQTRDAAQRRLTIDFDIAPERRLSGISFAALGIIGAVVASAFRPKRRSADR